MVRPKEQGVVRCGQQPPPPSRSSPSARGAALANSPRIPAEQRYYAYDAQVAACDDPGVIGASRAGFNWREGAHWNSRCSSPGGPRPADAFPAERGGSDPAPLLRRARAITSDGKHRPLYYYIVEDAGITGWHGSLLLGLIRYPTPGSFNVEWCIDGLDYLRTYAQNCRMARP